MRAPNPPRTLARWKGRKNHRRLFSAYGTPYSNRISERSGGAPSGAQVQGFPLWRIPVRCLL